jgi:hypothetical protein
MSHVPLWPPYLVAPNDSLLALGVVCVNYARFERAITWVFSAVTAQPEEYAAIIIARTNAVDRGRFIRLFLEKTDWPDEPLAKDIVQHFTKAADILAKNRNFLVHSNIVHATNDRAAFYVMSKRGNMMQTEAGLDEIRRVADDLYIYFNFGLDVANYIAVKIHKLDLEAGTVAFYSSPDKPPLPTPFHKEDQ